MDDMGAEVVLLPYRGSGAWCHPSSCQLGPEGPIGSFLARRRQFRPCPEPAPRQQHVHPWRARRLAPCHMGSRLPYLLGRHAPWNSGGC